MRFSKTGFIFVGILLIAIPSGEAQVLAQQVDWLPSIITVGPGADPETPMLIGRLSASHRIGEGIGFDDGYSTVEWLMPLFDARDDQMLFFDGRGIISNDGRLGSNIGFGYRKYFPEINRIVGAMGYWDTRQLDSDVFHQATFGIETLGQYFDARTFVYLPLTELGESAPAEPVATGPVFTGHRVVIGPLGPVAPGIRAAMRGVTTEVGLNSPWFGDFQVSGFAGVYRFDADSVPAFKGWSARAEVRRRDQFQVDVTFQDDDTLGQTTSVGMNVSQLFRFARFSKRTSTRHKFRGLGNSNVDSRLGERVRRLENIVTSKPIPQVPAIANNFSSGDRFFHVREGASGDGTFENPFGSINDAAAASEANGGFSYVYTRVGETFTEDVNLGSGVWLASNAQPRTVRLYDGDDSTTVTIPFSGADPSFAGSLTTIDGSLTIDDPGFSDVRSVDGFNITQGMTMTEVGFVAITNSRISNEGNAITLTDSGTIVLDNLTLTSTAGDGLEVNTNAGQVSHIQVRNLTIDAPQETDFNTDAFGSLIFEPYTYR